MIKEITDNNMAAVEASKLALVDFNATWCGPCKMLAPILSELSEEMPDVDFYGVDVDANQLLSFSYQINSVPTLVLFKDGKAVEKAIGFTPKANLKSWIEENR